MAGILEVRAFHCQAMAGMWSVRLQECVMKHTHTHTHTGNARIFSGVDVGTDVGTILARRNVIKNTFL